MIPYVLSESVRTQGLDKDSMKIIGLIPVRNEEWILSVTIPQLGKYVDQIICLDAGSVDGTIKILRSYGAEIIDGRAFQNDYGMCRQMLLDKGRENNGTHFVWLDADEAFTSNLRKIFVERLGSMKPGQKLALQWLCLWKDPKKYRDDGSVWTNLYKDFVFCDDGIASFNGAAQLHEGRTPGSNENTWISIPKDEGAVLHFQFVAFERFQMKQAFQRCRELFLGKADPMSLNEKYSITLDDSGAKCKDIPREWLEGIGGLEGLRYAGVDWYYPEILNLFEKMGILYFEPLQIWHVPQLYDEFIKRVGREPKSLLAYSSSASKLYSNFRMWIYYHVPRSLKDHIKNAFGRK